jgi:hypothetical protein
MITNDQTDKLLSITVLGEFTLGDFEEFEDLVLEKVSHGDTPSLLLDLREMADFTVDMAWEEIKFSRQHASDFRRIAVLTDSQWVAWSAWLEQLFLKSDIRVFADETEARAWLAEETNE